MSHLSHSQNVAPHERARCAHLAQIAKERITHKDISTYLDSDIAEMARQAQVQHPHMQLLRALFCPDNGQNKNCITLGNAMDVVKAFSKEIQHEMKRSSSSNAGGGSGGGNSNSSSSSAAAAMQMMGFGGEDAGASDAAATAGSGNQVVPSSVMHDVVNEVVTHKDMLSYLKDMNLADLLGNLNFVVDKLSYDNHGRSIDHNTTLKGIQFRWSGFSLYFLTRLQTKHNLVETCGLLDLYHAQCHIKTIVQFIAQPSLSAQSGGGGRDAGEAECQAPVELFVTILMDFLHMKKRSFKSLDDIQHCIREYAPFNCSWTSIRNKITTYCKHVDPYRGIVSMWRILGGSGLVYHGGQAWIRGLRVDEGKLRSMARTMCSDSEKYNQQFTNLLVASMPVPEILGDEDEDEA